MPILEGQRWLNVVWCDDIRQEIGDKPSFMGVYTSGLVLGEVPTTLYKLGLWVTANTPQQRPFRELTIRVGTAVEGQLLARFSLSSEQLQALADVASTNAVALESTHMQVGTILQIGPIPVTDETGYLKVFVDTEDETLESFRLRVSAVAAAPARD